MLSRWLTTTIPALRAEAGELLRIHGQPGLHSNTLLQKKQPKKQIFCLLRLTGFEVISVQEAKETRVDLGSGFSLQEHTMSDLSFVGPLVKCSSTFQVFNLQQHGLLGNISDPNYSRVRVGDTEVGS